MEGNPTQTLEMTALLPIPRQHYDMALPEVPLSHLAIRTPRADVIGEVVYAARWVELMDMPIADFWASEVPSRLHLVLQAITSEPTQRQATVAATFIQWLGCNCGQGFLHAAQQARANSVHPHQVAWAIHNHRSRGLNGGTRAIEGILAPWEFFSIEDRYLSALTRVPELTVDDYETVEHVVAWLDGCEGELFLKKCQADLELQARQRREFSLLEHSVRTSDTHLQGILGMHQRGHA